MRILENRWRLPAIIILIAAGVAGVIILTAPETEKKEPSRPVPAVEAIPLEEGNYALKVEAFGRVIPSREVTLTPEVTGKIVSMNPEMEPGGILKKGDLIIQIEKADYELAVERAAAGLREAEAALELEKGRQVVAKREWEIFGKDLDQSLASGELALRKPQLAQAEADVKSAQAMLKEANLDLERTTIRAPFDSLVLEESVEIGQRVAPEVDIVRIAGTDSYWVNASVPINSFRRIDPADNGEGSTVTLFLDAGLGGTITRCGKVIRKLGNLDPEGRMGRILISIDDPLLLEEDSVDSVIPLESYVRAEINAGDIRDVYKIPRRGLRENNTVWIADPDQKLRIKNVDIVWRYGDYVYVRDDFEAGDRLITSHIANVLPGMDVAVREQDTQAAGKRIASGDTEIFCGKE